jgi:predicted nucleic acid-binding protein
VNDCVVDASAVVDALGGKNAIGIALRTRITTTTCHAPHLIDAEVGHVLRRGVSRGELDEEEAQTGLRALNSIIDHRYPHPGRLSDLAWELRHVVSFYDGLYVALATMLRLPLLTTDLNLTKAPDLPCQFELIN